MKKPDWKSTARRMRRCLPLLALVLVGSLTVGGCKQQPLVSTPLAIPAFGADTLQRLQHTHLVNSDDVLAQKQLLANGEAGPYTTLNPYQPTTPMSFLHCAADPNCRYALLGTGLPKLQFPARPLVYDWWQHRTTDPATAEVCGVKFSDDTRTDYELKTFPNLDALNAAPGFILTHYQACGACSSLQDLAVYGALDLTVMGKTCSKRWSLADKKSCMQDIGFTEACAEAWAYNAQNTAQSCALVCLRTYGLLALLQGTENVPTNDADGNLNACLQCDEMMSGPGFQYSAGRIRRNSGIISEIERPGDQVYDVPHDYFPPDGE